MQEMINPDPNISILKLEIEGNLYVLSKVISWMKKASAILGFKYNVIYHGSKK